MWNHVRRAALVWLLPGSLLLFGQETAPPSVFDLPGQSNKRLAPAEVRGLPQAGQLAEPDELPKATPDQPVDGAFTVTESNVVWDSRVRVFRAYVKFAEPSELGEELAPIAVGLGEVGDLLRGWQEEGTAAGNHGDLYDNRDADHSNMNYKALPQLTRVEYSEPAQKRRLHYGVQRSMLFNAVTLGNSSTALTSSAFWRCQGRIALQSNGPGRLYLQYRSNHLYFYPEHRDHDPGHNGADGGGYGDVFPANTPYLILSQGSSGSDRAFMNAVAQTLAAFRPDVKHQLTKAGLLMPTVQMIFRSCNKMVTAPEDYLTGAAHPTVFDSKQLDVVKMVTMAHDMQPEKLPPLVQLEVVEEDQAVLGRDYFDSAPSETLLDTPCAIARVVKSTKYMRRMVIRAEDSFDPQNSPLTFHWVVLRGDAERIKIRSLNESGSVAELLIPHHARQAVPGSKDMESNRVDIGVFVHNGDYYSAPGFVSLYYLDNELRTYDEQHRIVAVDYVDPAVRGNYVDPTLDFRKDWRDEYHYSDDGQLQGWTRIRGKERQQFTAEGLLIVEPAENGQPAKTVAVRYVVNQPERNRAPVLLQETVPTITP